MNNVIIFGSYHGANKGDEAILVSLLRQIDLLDLKIKVVVPSTNPSYIQNKYGVDSINMKNAPKIIHRVYSSDIVIIGGGGLFFDYSFLDTVLLIKTQILYWIFIIFLSTILRKRIMVYGVGIGPLNSWVAKKLLVKAFNTVDIITVRDNQSKNLLTSLGISKIVHVTSDPVFSLNLSLPEAEIENKSEYIVVTIRSWNVEIDNKLIDIMSRFCDFLITNEYNIIIIPMNIKKDLSISEQLLSKIDSKNASILKCIEVHEIFSTIGAAKMIIGMRMHSLIFASLSGVPIIALSYNTQKVKEFMNQLDITEYLFDAEKVGIDTLIMAFDEIIRKIDSISISISKKVEELHIIETKNMELFKNLLHW